MVDVNKIRTANTLIMNPQDIKRIYARVHFPDYPPDALAKVKNEFHIESDQKTAKEQLRRAMAFIVARGVGEETKEGLTIQLSPTDLKLVHKAFDGNG